MKHSILVLVIAGGMLASCGTSKKLESANSQIQTLNGQVQELNNKISAGEKAISQLKTENIQYGKEAEDCRKLKEAVSKRLDELNNSLAEQGTSMKQIMNKTEEALQKFKDAGADVSYKNGVLHITMEDKLLFPSGSTEINVQGKEALKVIADVLNEHEKLTLIVVGNTDTDPVNKKKYTDNWSLSTERANSVVRLFRNDYGIDPVRMTSGGRSKYHPVADNITPEGKAKNRRIEIIINPDMSRLWKLAGLN